MLENYGGQFLISNEHQSISSSSKITVSLNLFTTVKRLNMTFFDYMDIEVHISIL